LLHEPMICTRVEECHSGSLDLARRSATKRSQVKKILRTVIDWNVCNPCK
jgi:hypothetical protein